VGNSIKDKAHSDYQRLISYFLGLFLIINVVSLIIYQFTNMKSDFFHEAAYPYLYAQSDIDLKTIFTSQFSGREIAPISWTLVAHFLLLVGFKLTFVTVATSNVIFLFFSIGVILWFGYSFALRKIQILTVLVLYTTIFGVRPFKYAWMDQVWIWPLNSYGIYDLFSLLLCIFAYKMISIPSNDASTFRVFTTNIFFLIPFFLFGLNHNRGLVQIYGPIAFSLITLYFVSNNHDAIFRKRCFQIFSLTLFVTAVGRIIIEILTKGVPQYWQEPSQKFTTLDQSNFTDKLFSPAITIFQLFGMNPNTGTSVVSPHGIRMFSLFALVLFLIYFPLVRYLKAHNFNGLSLAGKFMFLHFIYFVILAVLTSVFTTSAGVVRYLIPLAISAMFFLPFVYSESQKKNTYFTALLLLLIAPSVFFGAKQLNETLPLSYQQTPNYLLTQSLLERNLYYGYAGPWNYDALNIPFYSNGKIHVSLIDVAPLGPHLHANKAWFREVSHSGDSFVAFPTEAVKMDDKFNLLRKAAVSEYVIDRWMVLVFSNNPASLIGQLP
jgi:hypothetical protein